MNPGFLIVLFLGDPKQCQDFAAANCEFAGELSADESHQMDPCYWVLMFLKEHE